MSDSIIIKTGFSPCPNDTFMFDALVNGRIDTTPFVFDPVMADVEALNQMALRGDLDVTKLSFGVYPQVQKEYLLLDAGSALGEGCGPLLVAKANMNQSELADKTIAIPGLHTTAWLLMQQFFPEVTNVEAMLFSDIEEAVISGSVDAGLVIHESRFTYAARGLHLVADLGDLWEHKMQMPLPLGGIAVRRSLPTAHITAINQMMQLSVQYAFDHPQASADFVKAHAQEMDPQVMQQHIKLYVNDYSLTLGAAGRDAVMTLLAKSAHSIPDPHDIFVGAMAGGSTKKN